jgi:hypothetical protein
MVAIALVALGLGFLRVHPKFGIVYFVAVLAYPILMTRNTKSQPRRLRPDAKRVALCYLAGVLGPTICLLIDPFVFRGPPGGYLPGIFGSRRMYWYSFMVLEMVLLTLFLWSGSSLRPAVCAVISGAFWVGAFNAVGIGALLLPVSLIGLRFVVGALGFMPFLTAWAFLIQATIASGREGELRSAQQMILLELAGAALAVGLPVLLQLAVGGAGL